MNCTRQTQQTLAGCRFRTQRDLTTGELKGQKSELKKMWLFNLIAINASRLTPPIHFTIFSYVAMQKLSGGKCCWFFGKENHRCWKKKKASFYTLSSSSLVRRSCSKHRELSLWQSIKLWLWLQRHWRACCNSCAKLFPRWCQLVWFLSVKLD